MTTTTTQALYTRAIRIDQHVFEIQPGDQVDTSLDVTPMWSTVERVGDHVDDGRRDCDGDCIQAIYFRGVACSVPWHVQEDDEVYVRFPVEAT